jgi:SAM-dependent methyltransferase
MKKEFEHLTWLYVLTWPMIWLFVVWVRRRKRRGTDHTVACYSRWWDGLPAVHRMRESAAKWPALDAIYNWAPTLRGLRGWLEWYYLHGCACQALRNRYRCVVATLELAIADSITRHGEARILSLAAGTGQSVFEAAARFKGHVQIVAIDADDSALLASQTLAAHYGLTNVEWRCGNVLHPHTLAQDVQPTIIEVVGLFDYLQDATIRGLLRRLARVAAPDSVLITAHIHPHREALVIKELLDWEMTYRTRDDLERLLTSGGCSPCHLTTEPHGIFTVACGTLHL